MNQLVDFLRLEHTLALGEVWAVVPYPTPGVVDAARGLVPAHRMVSILPATHRHLLPSGGLALDMPADVGTAPAVITALLWLHHNHPDAVVAVFWPGAMSKVSRGAFEGALERSRCSPLEVFAVDASTLVGQIGAFEAALAGAAPRWWRALSLADGDPAVLHDLFRLLPAQDLCPVCLTGRPAKTLAQISRTFHGSWSRAGRRPRSNRTERDSEARRTASGDAHCRTGGVAEA